MNVILWIVAGVLAALFLLAGAMKALTPREQLAQKMGWVNDYPAGAVKFVGVVEVLGALGLVLPAALDIAPVLTPLAAAGLAVTMVLAAVVHVRRKEQGALVCFVLFLLAFFVAVMRFGPQSF